MIIGVCFSDSETYALYLILQVFLDWHLLMMVMMCVVIDVIILTIATAVDSARLKPTVVEDVRRVTEIDVRILVLL